MIHTRSFVQGPLTFVLYDLKEKKELRQEVLPDAFDGYDYDFIDTDTLIEVGSHKVSDNDFMRHIWLYNFKTKTKEVIEEWPSDGTAWAIEVEIAPNRKFALVAIENNKKKHPGIRRLIKYNFKDKSKEVIPIPTNYVRGISIFPDSRRVLFNSLRVFI